MTGVVLRCTPDKQNTPTRPTSFTPFFWGKAMLYFSAWDVKLDRCSSREEAVTSRSDQHIGEPTVISNIKRSV